MNEAKVRVGFLIFHLRSQECQMQILQHILRIKRHVWVGCFLEFSTCSGKESTENYVTLSVTKAELIAACECTQDMIQIKQIVTSLRLKVKTPMELYVDNCGVVDLVNKWSVSGHTQHVDVQYWWLRNLKEEGQLIVEWIDTESNTADLFTKNLGETPFKKHG